MDSLEGCTPKGRDLLFQGNGGDFHRQQPALLVFWEPLEHGDRERLGSQEHLGSNPISLAAKIFQFYGFTPARPQETRQSGEGKGMCLPGEREK
jgi:hypothetical protein